MVISNNAGFLVVCDRRRVLVAHLVGDALQVLFDVVPPAHHVRVRASEQQRVFGLSDLSELWRKVAASNPCDEAVELPLVGTFHAAPIASTSARATHVCTALPSCLTC